MTNLWLMKAEPDSRIVKGKDVKFSVDDFESCKTTAWEGVRNHEAKNIMKKQMKVGDKVLFYHSNCKNPGIAAVAEVSKEAYPDDTADDPTHPYYDAKSSSRPAGSEPTWWMVELTFGFRLKHFVPLWILRQISSCSSIDQVRQLEISSDGEPFGYLSADDLQALKKMPLLSRGRLSVQSVNADAWAAVEKLADRGGWDIAPKKSTNKQSKPTKRKQSDADDSPQAKENSDGRGRRGQIPRKAKRAKR